MNNILNKNTIIKNLVILLTLFFTALSANAYTEHEAIKILMDDNKEPSSKSVLMHAVIEDDFDTVKLYVQANQIDLNERFTGVTYLYMAAYYDHPEIALYLLNHGADPRIKTVDGGSALFYAVKNSQTHVVRKMLETDGINIKRHRMFFRAPLKTIAKRNGDMKIYQMLTEYEKEQSKK